MWIILRLRLALEENLDNDYFKIYFFYKLKMQMKK